MVAAAVAVTADLNRHSCPVVVFGSILTSLNFICGLLLVLQFTIQLPRTSGYCSTAAEDDDDSDYYAAAGSAFCDFGMVVALTTDYHAVLFQHWKFTIRY